MKRVAERIGEMLACHKEMLERVEKIEKALEKYRQDGNVKDMKLALDVFLLYMKTTVRNHKRSEEKLLFPFLGLMDNPKSDIDGLLKDHEEIHRNTEMLNLMKEMDHAAKERVVSGVDGLISTLKAHMTREEEMLKTAGLDKHNK
jgi:hemerythrin-like domain-containing protein